MPSAWIVVGIPALGFLLAFLALGGSLHASRRRRIIENIPTSKTTGIYIGLVELKGNAECASPLTSFLAEVPCVYYQWSVEEHWSRTVTETHTDAQGKTTITTRHESGWTSVDNGHEQIPFYLRDDVGEVLVRPEGAEIEPETVFSETCTPSDPLYYEKGPDSAIMHSDHQRLFSETALRTGCSLYIVGQAREREDVVAPEITADPDAPMFLISTRTEEKVTAGLKMQIWIFGILGLVLAAGGFWMRDLAARKMMGPNYDLYLHAGAGYCLVYLLGWCWMAYNSLANLRQRVRQAWSLVEVQTKRRATLIPNLVSVVIGLRDYEREIQTQLSLLRTQIEATPPGVRGPDYQACTRAVRAIAEAYPELHSQESFLKLQNELVATEERIAMARGYFNEIVTHYNTRLQVIPEGLLAGLAGFRAVELMSANGFERAAVTET